MPCPISPKTGLGPTLPRPTREAMTSNQCWPFRTVWLLNFKPQIQL
ncbi:UNVERIFIED_CONTAM: hypothetical protein GTU68_018831 [Idotea baltica]|nr:hypothetical protein [Idotea baltica]